MFPLLAKSPSGKSEIGMAKVTIAQKLNANPITRIKLIMVNRCISGLEVMKRNIFLMLKTGGVKVGDAKVGGVKVGGQNYSSVKEQPLYSKSLTNFLKLGSLILQVRVPEPGACLRSRRSQTGAP